MRSSVWKRPQTGKWAKEKMSEYQAAYPEDESVAKEANFCRRGKMQMYNMDDIRETRHPGGRGYRRR